MATSMHRIGRSAKPLVAVIDHAVSHQAQSAVANAALNVSVQRFSGLEQVRYKLPDPVPHFLNSGIERRERAGHCHQDAQGPRHGSCTTDQSRADECRCQLGWQVRKLPTPRTLDRSRHE